MRALWLGLTLLALPLAAGAQFIALPPTASGALVPCGELVCAPLLLGESTVRIAGASGFAFLGKDGATLAAGSACGSAWLDVPPAAAVMALDLRPCP